MKEKKYLLDRRSFPVRAALVCLLLAFVLRGVSALLNRVVFEDTLTLFSLLLFLGSCLLYGLSLILFGRKWLWVTTGPFVLGVMAFVSRLYTFDNLLQVQASIPRMLISMLFYLVVTAVYAVTVSGGFRGRWLLVLLFLVPLAGHIVFDIIPAFKQGIAIAASQVLAELSVLAVIFGMIFTALSFRHTLPAPAEKKKKVDVPVPPQPGNKLDEKPPVVSDPAQVEETAAASEPKTAPDEKEEIPVEAESAVEAEESETISEAADTEDEDTESETEEYDPFAPSTEPIRLTLDPLIEKTEETGSSVSGDEKG